MQFWRSHMREKYRKRLLVYFGILFCLISLVGVSYAVFNGYASQSSTNSLAATCVELVFSGENSVNLTNAYPISTAEGLKTTPYTFKIKNNCENYMQYTIIASVINTTNVLDSKFVRVALNGDDVVSPTNISVLKKINTPASLSGYSIKENFVLSETMGISKNEEKNFKFRMWLDGDSSETWTSEQVEGKNYQVKISVVATVKTKPADDLYIASIVNGTESDAFPTTNEYDASVSCENESGVVDTGASISWRDNKWLLSIDDVSTGGTKCTVKFTDEQYKLLTAVIKGTNNANVSVAQTTPGSEASADTEAVLASTQDDYGTSYYFRGAVTNNFVEYANMCWRIVRVTGDGSIKLVLYNYNGLTSANNTPSSSSPCSENGTSLAYLRTTASTSIFTFNTTNNDNAYVGLMYGTAGASSYADAHTNTNASTILTNLNKWYTNVLSKQANFNDSQLADTIWCNDKSVVTDATFNPGSYTLGTNYGYGKNNNYYSTAKRLVQASSWSAGGTGPSLICPNDNNGGKLSKFTVSDTTYGNGALSGYAKVGLLTADEIALAGGAYGKTNTTYYIKGNASSNFWWALSPIGFDGNSAYVWGVDGLISDLVYDNVNVYYGVVRPSLSLQSGVKISSSGIGSATSPYKIVA